VSTSQEHAERIAKALEAIDAIEPEGNMLAEHEREDTFIRRVKAYMQLTSVSTQPALTALLSERTALLARVGELEEDLRVAKSFGDLWYFVMDENPSGFEKIISEWSSSFWLDKAIDLRRAALKGQR
jgi:hypothetical protein